jgi:AcrR family transcriptional regulator
MGIAERREREKEALRTRIVEAARDIVSEQGLHALSMRAIAERIEYSPGTLYLYFRDKEELLREVVHAGFQRMSEQVQRELADARPDGNPMLMHRCLGRAYAKFALENTAYFRVMFELPAVAQMECPSECATDVSEFHDEGAWAALVNTVQAAIDEGQFTVANAQEGALVSWGLIHGLTSLYLSGHLQEAIASNQAFLELVERAMDSLGSGLTPRETGAGSGA